MAKKYSGGGFTRQSQRARRWLPGAEAGLIFARCRKTPNVLRSRQGFSLAECLVALLILSLSLLLLSGYHQRLVNGYRMRQAQRDALWAATQTLAGKPPQGWHSEVLRVMTPEGCQQITARVRGPFNRQFALEQLFCPPFDDHLPESRG